MLRSTWLLVVLACVAGPGSAAGQAPATIRVDVTFERTPVPDAEVIVNGMTHKTDPEGNVSIPIGAGTHTITVIKQSFAPVTSSVTVLAGQTQSVVVELQRQPTLEEEVTVSATRTDKRLEDQPMRVEVLARDEIEEKLLMTPGDIVMMLNEMGGMRVQATSPSLGAASVRIQGMRGRYTRVFSDGLPLFGEVGGLGLLQIPPMDLGQVEVIKGVASSMYGAGAMGGIVNLISRRPGQEAEREFLFNRSTRGGTDAVAWYATSGAPRGWAFTLLGGGHWQDATDVNDDAWADLPGYTRGVVRPRVFWNGGNGRTFFATAGFTAEDRSGGTVSGAVLPATGLPYIEALKTRRADAGAVGQILFSGRYLLSARGAVMQQRHDHQFGEVRERDRHETVFAEATVRAPFNRHTLVAGIAVERDSYTPTDVPQFAYTFTVPGVFVQDDVELTRWLSVSASGRVDHHSEYGTFLSPRVAALFRSKKWNSRVSFGTGFFGPSPLTEETEAAGLSRLQIPQVLRAEEGRSASMDVSRTDGPVSYTFTVFGSRIHHPIHVNRSTGFVLTNLSQPATNIGVELLGTIRREPFSLTTTYTYVRSREVADGTADDVPLTPRHSAGIVGMWERKVGRVGVEFYYTGIQNLEENPYRGRSEPYVIAGVLAERQFGWARLFINGENLTGVRQTRWDPLLRPTRAPDGRWTVDAWQPLEGRNINGGIRVGF